MEFRLAVLLAMFLLRTEFVEAKKKVVQKQENGSNFKHETAKNSWVKSNVTQQKRNQTKLNVKTANSELGFSESNIPTTTVKPHPLTLFNENKNIKKPVAANKKMLKKAPTKVLKSQTILQNTKGAKMPTALTKSVQLNVPVDLQAQKTAKDASNEINIDDKQLKLKPFLQQLVIDNPKIESILDSIQTDNWLKRFPTSFVDTHGNSRLGLQGNDMVGSPSYFDHENLDSDQYSYEVERTFQINADLFNENDSSLVRDEQDKPDIIGEEFYERIDVVGKNTFEEEFNENMAQHEEESEHASSNVSQFLHALLQNNSEINKPGLKELFEDHEASFFDYISLEVTSQAAAKNKHSAYIYPVITFVCVLLFVILLNVYVLYIFDRNKSRVKRLHRMIKRRREPRPDKSKYKNLSQNDWLLEQC